MINVANAERQGIGWTECAKCGTPFLGMVGMTMQCPCGHSFLCTATQLVPCRTWEAAPTTPSGPAMLLRAEMWCARFWAEAKADAEGGAGDRIADAVDWYRAWGVIKARRFGQIVEYTHATNGVTQKGPPTVPGEGSVGDQIR